MGVLAAPVREREENGEGCSALGSFERNRFDEILGEIEQDLLNNTDNLDRIKKAFNFDLNTVKVCIAVKYTSNCTCDEWTLNCDNSTRTIIWTSFNPSRPSGKLLILYGSLNLNVFGFEWEDACNIRTDGVWLSIAVPSLCDMDDDDINTVLGKLTEKVKSSGSSHSVCVHCFVFICQPHCSTPFLASTDSYSELQGPSKTSNPPKFVTNNNGKSV